MTLYESIVPSKECPFCKKKMVERFANYGFRTTLISEPIWYCESCEHDEPRNE